VDSLNSNNEAMNMHFSLYIICDKKENVLSANL